jgi:hypothetical protein
MICQKASINILKCKGKLMKIEVKKEKI